MKKKMFQDYGYKVNILKVVDVNNNEFIVTNEKRMIITATYKDIYIDGIKDKYRKSTSSW